MRSSRLSVLPTCQHWLRRPEESARKEIRVIPRDDGDVYLLLNRESLAMALRAVMSSSPSVSAVVGLSSPLFVF
jgi:hypothetical protein